MRSKLVSQHSLDVRKSANKRLSLIPNLLQSTDFAQNHHVLLQKQGCVCEGSCPRCVDVGVVLQPKLEIGAPNDKYEQEADQVAEMVMCKPISNPIGAIAGNELKNSSSALRLFRAPTPSSRSRVAPAWHEVPLYGQNELNKKGFGTGWYEYKNAITRQMILNLYVKLKGVKLWRYVLSNARTSSESSLEFNSDVVGLKEALADRKDFTDPEDSEKKWTSREKKTRASLHFKHFSGWPIGQVQAHIDPVGIWGSPIPIIGPLIQLFRHWADYSGYKDSFRIRDILFAEGWDPVALKGITAGTIRRKAQSQAVMDNDEGPALNFSELGAGQPLSASTRSFFEQRFGYDFAGVRVHTGSSATNIAQAVKARAFTLGHNVVFGAGQYAPQTESGKRLLAHELTHVVQANSPQTDKGNAHQKTDSTSDQTTHEQPVTISQLASPKAIMRQEHEVVENVAGELYEVQKGESLGDIAKKKGVTIKALVEANQDLLKVWPTPTGKKVYGFEAKATIVIPEAKAPTSENAESRRSWRERTKEIFKGATAPLKQAWSYLSGWFSEEEEETTGDKEKKGWAASTMPGPVKGGADKKTNMDAAYVEKLNNICGRMKAQGYDTTMYWGYRTEAEQVHIATAGRSFDEFKVFMEEQVVKGNITKESSDSHITKYDPNQGKHAMRKEKKEATWTLKSSHRKGKAADVVHPTGFWEPPEGNVYWTALKTAAEAEGLQIGPPADDLAHVQVP